MEPGLACEECGGGSLVPQVASTAGSAACARSAAATASASTGGCAVRARSAAAADLWAPHGVRASVRVRVRVATVLLADTIHSKFFAGMSGSACAAATFSRALTQIGYRSSPASSAAAPPPSRSSMRRPCGSCAGGRFVSVGFCFRQGEGRRPRLSYRLCGDLCVILPSAGRSYYPGGSSLSGP
eukprot:scaffold54657_cov66-Phaeocystis_antarctica.AAC.2